MKSGWLPGRKLEMESEARLGSWSVISTLNATMRDSGVAEASPTSSSAASNTCASRMCEMAR
jgi:hypothetical protein